MHSVLAATLLLIALLQNIVFLQCQLAGSNRSRTSLVLCLRRRCGPYQLLKGNASKRVGYYFRIVEISWDRVFNTLQKFYFFFFSFRVAV